MAKQFDVVVIGAGPGGYVAAIKCAQLGMKVACIESRETLGGTCLNVGCIPSKALLNASHKYDEAKNHLSKLGIEAKGISLDLKKMMTNKDTIVSDLTKGIAYLFKKNSIEWITGLASFTSNTEITIKNGKSTQNVIAKNFIIATGSNVTTLPNIKIDEERIVSSTGVLSLKEVPKHLVVMGGGYIGLEMASVWNRLGAKVSVVEFANKIVPAMDNDVSSELQKLLEKQGVQFYLNHKVIAATIDKKHVNVDVQALDGKTKTLSPNVFLVSIGRHPNTNNLNLAAANIALDEQGFIPVNKQYQTSISNIYAIGDVIGGMMLAHKAEDEGMAVAEILSGQKPHINYNAIPAVIYTHPEVACVGKTSEELSDSGVDIKSSKFPMSANSRAKANNDTNGFVKIITNAHTDQVLGIHIIASNAGAMIAEAALAMEYSASAEDIARTCHAHPTTSEALKEAALGAWSQSLHL